MKFLKFNKKALAFVALLTVVTVGMVAIFGLVDDSVNRVEGVTDPKNPVDDYGNGNVVYYQNEEYVPDRNIETVLILGIDHNTDASREYNYQSDFMAVCIINNATGTFEILHINRDTITEINKMNDIGKSIGKDDAQICLAHAYGNNETMRCMNSVDAVEKLLYGVEIDHYLSMTMDAIPILNDSIGGVTLELMDDFTMVDPSMKKGITYTLKGKQALDYVQARGQMEDATNLHRMERQRQYIGAFSEQFKKKSDTGESLISGALLDAASYIFSDLSLQQLSDFGEKVKDYHPGSEIHTFEGSSVKENGYMSFYLDEESAKETIIKLFYVKKS